MSFSPPDPTDAGPEHSIDADLMRIEAPVRLGRYRLCYELGSGGMASVYLARSEGPGGFAKAVAIKRIHPHLARRRELVEMFLDEARIASLISHPNVCSTFDFGEIDGTYFLAMEYLVGEPLSLVLGRATRTPGLLESDRWQRCFAKIVADAAEGLHAAHELKDERGRALNVVHRDVSPQNLFVTYDGVAKVVDFGVAFANDRITRTVTGGIKGKLGYLAPEQLARAPYDRRLDVWALGIVLWEGLTGQRLFLSRSEVDTLLAVQHRVIPPPSSIVRTVPPALDAIVLRALARSPEQRYQTTRAIGRDIAGWLAESGQPITNVEVGELLVELCADRRDVRAEVVASVLEPVPRPRTETVAPPGLGAIDPTEIGPPPVEPTVLARAPRVHAPPIVAAPRVADPLPRFAPAPAMPLAPEESTQTRTIGRLVGLAGVAVLALGVVAVAAIVTVGSLERGTTPTPTPTSVAASPSTLAPTSVVLARAPSDPIVPASALVPDTDAGVAIDAGAPPPDAWVAPRDTGAPRARVARARGSLSVICPSLSVTVCVRGHCAATPTRFDDVPEGLVVVHIEGTNGRTATQQVQVRAHDTARVVVTPP